MSQLHQYRKDNPLYKNFIYMQSQLQTITELPDSHPEVNKMFENGFHSIRQSDRFWAGLSTDLVIEQALMHSIKSYGGLTRGRVMTELQHAIWQLSTPVTAEINHAMQEFTGIKYQTSDQHKDVTK